MENEFEAELQTKIENYGRTGHETEANIDRLQKEVSTNLLVFVFLIILFFQFIVKDFIPLFTHMVMLTGCLLYFQESYSKYI